MSDKIQFQTPKGVAVYPRLKTPDTKFDDNGQYKADLKVSADVAKPFITKFRQVYKDHVGSVLPKKPDRSSKTAFYYFELDDEGEETGDVIFKLRVKNKITRKGDLWDRRPAQFDAKGSPISDPKNVGGGSTLLVAGEVYLWQNPSGGKGMSLQPEAIQILDLKEFIAGGKSAGDFGFGSEEGFTDDSSHGFGDETCEDKQDTVPADEDDDDY